MFTIDETVKVQEFCINQFEKLGLSSDEAIRAFDEGIDWHDFERLTKNGCTNSLALKILAGSYDAYRIIVHDKAK
jgi:hypothetical protein